MSKFRLLATALLVALCTGLCSCSGDDEDKTITSNEGGNSSIAGTTAKVDLKKAGSLSTLISDDVKFNITDLTITGDINGDDIILIREMAGADINGDETKGRLSVLDLKDANIVAGGNPYYIGSTMEIFYSKKNIVGSYMFSNCKKLINVIFPNNATEIGSNIFNNTDANGYSIENPVLTSVVIGDKVTIINSSAFSECTKLTNIMIPTSVTQIGNSAFYGCTSLISIKFPENLWNIESNAFSRCTNLSEVTIPASVNYIGDRAFSRCNIKEFIVSEANRSYSSLDGVLFNKDKSRLLIYPKSKPSSSYVIPNSVVTIEQNAFSDCTLTSITIGDGLTHIISNMTSKLTEYIVSEDNSNFSSLDGVLFNKDKTRLIAYPKAKTNSSYTIPSSITEIDNKLFSDCSNLITLNLNNVTRIGTPAFVGSYIKSFIVSDTNSSYSTLDGVLFNKVKTSLIAYPMALMRDYANGKGSSYIIPDGVETINQDAFFPIMDLINIDGVTYPQYYPLETLTIPASVNYIDNGEALFGVLNIHCKGEVPPNIYISSFSQYPFSGRNIYVPMSAVNTYKQAIGWKDNNIIGE